MAEGRSRFNGIEQPRQGRESTTWHGRNRDAKRRVVKSGETGEEEEPAGRGGAGFEVGLGEDDEVPGLEAEAEEEGPEAVVGGEEAPGATHGAGAHDVGRAQQAEDLRQHVDRHGVERAQGSILCHRRAAGRRRRSPSPGRAAR